MKYIVVFRQLSARLQSLQCLDNALEILQSCILPSILYHFSTLRCHGVVHDDVIKREHFSALLALCTGNSPVTGEFSSQRPVTRSIDVFFDIRLNKRLSKQSSPQWFETPSRHCIVKSVLVEETDLFILYSQVNYC